MTRQLHRRTTFSGKVVIASGHMIDGPDRVAPRFPESQAELVRGQIVRRLAQWDIGPNDRAICGGANGADLLFAEECLRRGAGLRLFLAQEVDAFVRDSVQPAGSDWVQRFHRVAEKAQIETLSLGSDNAQADLSIYARTNLWIIETARAEVSDASKLCALLVWDEKSTGDGPGGTSDFETRVRHLGGHIAIINPARLEQ